MAEPKKTSTVKYGVCVLMLLLALFALTQTTQTTYAQTASSPWQMSLQTQLVGSNSSSTVFSPFDLIQLTANVTYNNASQPDIMVYFNVTGPVNSTNPTIINMIETTNDTGLAGFSFRLPIQSQNDSPVTGTWQASASLQTDNGTVIQQNIQFTVQWSLQITSITLQNAQGQSQTSLSPGDTVAVQAEVSDQGSDLTANATVTMQDATGQTINQTQTQNLQFTSTNQTQVQTLIQIPDNATAGQGTINLAIYAETYNGTDIPAAANQNVQFTISSDGNVTATTTSSPTPTPGPTVLPLVYQNAMGLFSWLLVATGLFTFTGLTMFLRRKTVQTGPQLPLPNIPITSTNSTVDTQPVQTPLQEPSPTPKTSTDKIMQAAVTTEQLPTVYETWNATPTQASKPEKEIDLTQEPAAQATSALSSRISSATKRIQAIKSILESEMEQLAQEVTELNKIVNERERAVKDYFETLREETEKAKRLLNSNEDTLDETTKPISAPNLSEEPTLQAILTYRSRIANTEKIIQALNISLKIEKEKLAPDLMEFNKQIDEREKALKKYIDALRRESEKAQTYLNGKEK